MLGTVRTRANRPSFMRYQFLLVLALLLPFGIKAQTCDPEIQKHVYNPQRLEVLKPCVTVTGTIIDATRGRRKDGVRKEADGDTHGWLKLDPGQEQYLNAGNLNNESGNLVFEIVCYFPVTQADAKAACVGYKNAVKLFPVGSHVSITGPWVKDDNHAHWNEIHAVSSMRRLP